MAVTKTDEQPLLAAPGLDGPETDLFPAEMAGKILAVFGAVAAAVGQRAALLLTLLAAAFLAFRAIDSETIFGPVVLGIFAALVVLPMVALSARRAI